MKVHFVISLNTIIKLMIIFLLILPCVAKGVELEISIKPENLHTTPGEPFYMIASLKNIGDKILTFGLIDEYFFSFSVIGPDGKVYDHLEEV